MTITERQPLTDRQEQVYRAILEHYWVHGHAPALREIGLVLGIRSPNGVVCHMRALHQKGWIVWDCDTRSRAIEVVGLTDEIKRVAREFLDRLSQGEAHG